MVVSTADCVDLANSNKGEVLCTLWVSNYVMCTKSTTLAVHPSLLVLCPDPTNVHARGPGYTSLNPWALFGI